MLDILQFIFSDVWHWFGSLILLSLPAVAVGNMFRGLVSIHNHRHYPASKKDSEVS